jgi:hypothetical protein
MNESHETTASGDTEDIRKTFYEASLKNRFVVYREVKHTVADTVPLEQFIEILLDKSPTAIYHQLWSADKPLYVIPKRIYRSHGGVIVYSNKWADKTPVFKTWKEFYDELRIQGMEHFKF